MEKAKQVAILFFLVLMGTGCFPVMPDPPTDQRRPVQCPCVGCCSDKHQQDREKATNLP
jgi:hypothetical protein